MNRRLERWLCVACAGCLVAGCGDSPAPPAAVPPAVTQGAPAAVPTPTAPEAVAPPSPVPAPLPRISLGGSGGANVSAGPSTGSAGPSLDTKASRDAVLAALKPMQILRDEWNGIRQKSVGGQDAGEDFSWIWDHRTNPRQPALVMQSPNGKYFRDLRLSYDPATSQFQLQLTAPDDQERTLVGDYSQPVEEVQMGDNKVHRVYKLTLTEAQPADPKDQWQVTLNQQENNRYLLELERKRGSGWTRFETISAQRKGTSFALSDTDYGDKTCVISGGLGTTQVSFNGKSYWVCCSGCQAAFEEDPARWIAEFEAKQKAAVR